MSSKKKVTLCVISQHTAKQSSLATVTSNESGASSRNTVGGQASLQKHLVFKVVMAFVQAFCDSYSQTVMLKNFALVTPMVSLLLRRE